MNKRRSLREAYGMLVDFYEAERIPDFGRNLSPMHTFFCLCINLFETVSEAVS